jgi:septation ring formation regulator EzrA
MDISVTLDQIKAMSVEERIQLVQAIQDTIPTRQKDLSSLQTDCNSPSVAWEKAMQQIEANQPRSLDRLLKSWEDEGDAQEHLETWEFLKQALDEDRISNRPLFS